MKPGILFWWAVSAALLAQAPDPTAELDRVARTATAMVDGDVCQRIQTKRSEEYLFKVDPRDQYLASDNFDVDHAAYIQTKKTLMRLSKLCPGECDVNLWMPLSADPGQIQILIRNVYEMSSFWKWGKLYQPMPAEMKRVLSTGERVTVRGAGSKLSVLAPVYNSLGDIVGLVEVVAEAKRDLQENVK